MTLQDQILATLDLPDPEASTALVDALAADWAREAGEGADRDEIVEVLVQDLADAAAGVPREERAGLLEARVAGREVRQIAAATYTLAEQLHQTAVEPSVAKTRAEELTGTVTALRQRVESRVPATWRDDLLRTLEDALLEARWVTAGGEGPTSGRLSRYLADNADEDEPIAPPDLSP